MRIVIYGCGVYAQIIEEYIKNIEAVSIEYFVETTIISGVHNGYKVVSPEDIKFNMIDYVVISSLKYKEEILKELEARNSAYRDFKDKVVDFNTFMELIYVDESDYRVATVNGGISYLYRREDLIVGPRMRYSKKNHGAEELRDLLSFVEKNVKDYDPSGYFFDIGANIGTASIFAKKYNPQFKVIAFEPGKMNYDLLRVNCILNQVEDVEIEKVGLGAIPENRRYAYLDSNPGGSEICDRDIVTGENVEIRTLDDYLAQKAIDPRKISFIWMDTEGFESEVIIGSRKTLETKSIPMIHELNPRYYRRRGTMEQYAQIMKESYSFFFDVRKRDMKKLEILSTRDLDSFLDQQQVQTDLFFFS